MNINISDVVKIIRSDEVDQYSNNEMYQHIFIKIIRSNGEEISLFLGGEKQIVEETK